MSLCPRCGAQLSERLGVDVAQPNARPAKRELPASTGDPGADVAPQQARAPDGEADRRPALCPRCLLQSALAPPDDLPEARPGTRFGDYELLERIARGGMGVVYKAKKEGLDRIVALKMVLAGELADEDENRLFRAEAQAAVMLDHPNITPVYEVGEIDDCPYFTMRYMEGGTLAKLLPALRLDRRRGVDMLRTIALAVHYGHQRGVLHRDLKPSNVLLDEAGTPYVADFGTAKRLTEGSGHTRTGAVVGTPSYMAPEQASGDAKRVTTAADVYGLGAMLYEMLTGRPPLVAESAQRLFEVLATQEPVRPRLLDRSIDRDLETICLKCLEKAPERRYTSARALAADLDHYLQGEPIEARPVGRVQRTWRWANRHPVLSSVGVALAIATLAALSTARAQEQQLKEDVLQADAYAARMAAGTVLFQLRQYADAVETAAKDPAMVERLERRGSPALPPLPAPAASECDSVLLQDVLGLAVARWPAPPEGYVGRDFAWRDYFAGTVTLGGRVHVSRAFRSEVDDRLKFAVSVPVRGADGDIVGVLGAHFGTDSVLGPLNLGTSGDADRTAALVGPRDRDRDGGSQTEYVFLVHDGLQHGRPIAFDLDALGDIAERGVDELKLPDPQRVAVQEDYRDPVPGFEGRWLAGLAPVGDTGLVIVVQTRHGPARIFERVALLFGLPVGLGALLIGALRWRKRGQAPFREPPGPGPTRAPTEK
jgi:hypothetical protein